jgi:hypothetical protein
MYIRVLHLHYNWKKHNKQTITLLVLNYSSLCLCPIETYINILILTSSNMFYQIILHKKSSEIDLMFEMLVYFIFKNWSKLKKFWNKGKTKYNLERREHLFFLFWIFCFHEINIYFMYNVLLARWNGNIAHDSMNNSHLALLFMFD